MSAGLGTRIGVRRGRYLPAPSACSVQRHERRRNCCVPCGGGLRGASRLRRRLSLCATKRAPLLGRPRRPLGRCPRASPTPGPTPAFGKRKRQLAEWPARRVGPAGLLTLREAAPQAGRGEERAAGMQGRLSSLMRAASSMSTSSDVKALFTKGDGRRRDSATSRAETPSTSRRKSTARLARRQVLEPPRSRYRRAGRARPAAGPPPAHTRALVQPPRAYGPGGDVRWTTRPMRDPSAQV
jgi:hypothetical protein